MNPSTDIELSSQKNISEENNGEFPNNPTIGNFQFTPKIRQPIFGLKKHMAYLHAAAEAKLKRHLLLFPSLKEGYMNFIQGKSEFHPFAEISIDSRAKLISFMFLNNLQVKLKQRKDLLDLFQSGLIDHEIAIELFQLNASKIKEDKLEQQQFTDTSHIPEAREIAEMIHTEIERSPMEKMNQKGAELPTVQSYVASESHNIERMLNGGYSFFEIAKNSELSLGMNESKEAWIQFILPRLDEERSFAGKNADLFLSNVYDQLVTGIHSKTSEWPTDNLRSASNAKSPAKYHKLYFKDAESWMEYNERFGFGNLRESIFHAAEVAGKRLALLEAYGPCPEKLHSTIMRSIKAESDGKEISESTLKNTDKSNDILVDSSPDADDLFYELYRSSNDSMVTGLTQWLKGEGTLQRMHAFGEKMVSHMPDIADACTHSYFRGKPLIVEYESIFSKFFKIDGQTDEEAQKISRYLSVGLESLQKNFAATIWKVDVGPGKAIHLQSIFFTYKLINWQSVLLRKACCDIIAHHVGELTNKEWNNLPSHEKELFSLHDISEKEWEAVRQTRWTDHEGRKFLTPDQFHKIPEDIIHKLIQSEYRMGKAGSKRFTALSEKRNELETKWNAYYLAQGQRAIAESISNSADFHFASNILFQEDELEDYKRRNSLSPILKEAISGVAQLFEWMLRMIHGVGKDATRDNSLHSTNSMPYNAQKNMLQSSTLFHLANLIAAQAVLALASQYIQEIEEMASDGSNKKRKPKLRNDFKTWRNAFTKSGSMVLYGDLLFSQLQKLDPNMLISLLGFQTRDQGIEEILETAWNQLCSLKPNASTKQMKEFQEPELAEQFKQSKQPENSARIFKIFLKNTPFINLYSLAQIK